MSSFDAVMAVMMHDVMCVWKDTVVVVVVLVDDIWYSDVVKDRVCWKDDDDPHIVFWDCSMCDVSFRPLYHDDVVVRLSCVSYR